MRPPTPSSVGILAPVAEAIAAAHGDRAEVYTRPVHGPRVRQRPHLRRQHTRGLHQGDGGPHRGIEADFNGLGGRFAGNGAPTAMGVPGFIRVDTRAEPEHKVRAVAIQGG